MNITIRALIFNKNYELLTVQHHGSMFWSLPGGKIEEGENMKECLQREILEELGLESEIQNLAFVHEFQWSETSDITVEFFFIVKISEENIDAFTGKYAEQELKKISWNILDDQLDIKPEFLQKQNIKNMKKSVQYFSYI